MNKKLDLGICNSFWIRSKDNTEITRLVTITEISLNSKGNIASIGLGVSTFSPEELLKTMNGVINPPKIMIGNHLALGCYFKYL